MFGTTKNEKYEEQKSKLAPDIQLEMGRRKNQANRILADLIIYGERLTSDLEKHAFNYTMRVSELRKRGYIIECEYVKQGVYCYKYYGFKPGTKAARERTGK